MWSEALLFLLMTAELISSCDHGWVRFQDNCYFHSKCVNLTSSLGKGTKTIDYEGHREIATVFQEPLQNHLDSLGADSQGRVTYKQAGLHCRRMEGDLVIIRSLEEEEFLYTFADYGDLWIRGHHSGDARNEDSEYDPTKIPSHNEEKHCMLLSTGRRQITRAAKCEELHKYICKRTVTNTKKHIKLISRLKKSIKAESIPGMLHYYKHSLVKRGRRPWHNGSPPIRFEMTLEHRLRFGMSKKNGQENLPDSILVPFPDMPLGSQGIEVTPTLFHMPSKHRLKVFGGSEALPKVAPLTDHMHSSLYVESTSNPPPLTTMMPDQGENATSMFQTNSTYIPTLSISSTGELNTSSIQIKVNKTISTAPRTKDQTFLDIRSSSSDAVCNQGDVLYHGYCYTLPDPSETAHASMAGGRCTATTGGDLVFIRDLNEMQFLSKLMQNITTRVWIGLSYHPVARRKVDVIWNNNDPLQESFVDYLNSDGIGSDVKFGCASVPRNLTEPRSWRLQSCTQLLPYICKYPNKTSVSPEARCVGGWHQNEESCYKVFAKPATWDESEAHCKRYRAHLTSVSSIEEEDVLRRLAQNADVSEFFYSFWIGLKISRNGHYDWIDGTLSRYVNWAAGQPDLHQEKGDCGSATRSSFRLHDSPCTASLPFICKAIAGTMLVPDQPPPRIPNSLCDDDPSWLLYDDHCYKIISSEAEEPQTWSQSLHLCRDIGGELASIHSFGENYWLQSKVHSVKDNVLWIGGLSYMDSGYDWSDKSPLDFTNWAKGEPNNHYDQEDCIAFYTRNFGYWNDQNCGHKQGRICKRPLGSTHPPPVVTPPPKGNCPTGWMNTGTKCLKFSASKITFDKARRACKTWDSKAELVSIESAKEQAYITAILGELKTNLWIGLRSENGFHWIDQSALTYTNWAQGEPSSGGWQSEVEDENCVNTHIYNLAGQWNNINCNARLGFICQLKLDSSIPSSDPLPACSVPFESYFNYSGKCYKPMANLQTWKEAEQTCSRERGHLVSSANRGESAWVWVLAQKFGLDNPWIGYSNIKDKNVFEWSDTWPTLYTKWGNHEPIISEVNFKCVTVSSEDGLWYARACEEQRHFICKYTDESFPTPDTPAGGSCPNANWLDLGGSYCYLLVTDASPWPDANKRCANEGSNLTSIHSKTELDLIVQAAYNIPDPLWIGLVQMKDGFGWSDGTGYDFLNWQDGEPNGEGEECTEIYPGTGLWNDAFCSNARPFVCKVTKTVGHSNFSGLGTPAEHSSPALTSSSSSSTGAILGTAIPLLLIIFSGLLYLLFRQLKKKSSQHLSTADTFGYDNAAYLEDDHYQVDLTPAFSLQKAPIDPCGAKADGDDEQEDKRVVEDKEEEEEETT